MEIIVVESVFGEVVDMMCYWGENHDDKLGVKWYRQLASQDFTVNIMTANIVRDKYFQPDIPSGLQNKVSDRLKTKQNTLSYQ